MGIPSGPQSGGSKVRFIPLTYNSAESQTSALRLILTLRPEWEGSSSKIEFIRFTDGITNTLLKVINRKPGLSTEEIDNEAVLLRAYGQGTDLIIDRERETQNHELLMQYNLAPALLARFHNGMLYRFIRGSVTSPADLRQQDIWRAVAKRLAEWHAIVPCLPASHSMKVPESEDIAVSSPTTSRKNPELQAGIDSVAPGKPVPNVWTVMQKWIYALPTATEAELLRQAQLQKELIRLVEEFSNRPGLGQNSVCNFLLSYHEVNNFRKSYRLYPSSTSAQLLTLTACICTLRLTQRKCDCATTTDNQCNHTKHHTYRQLYRLRVRNTVSSSV